MLVYTFNPQKSSWLNSVAPRGYLNQSNRFISLKHLHNTNTEIVLLIMSLTINMVHVTMKTVNFANPASPNRCWNVTSASPKLCTAQPWSVNQTVLKNIWAWLRVFSVQKTLIYWFIHSANQKDLFYLYRSDTYAVTLCTMMYSHYLTGTVCPELNNCMIDLCKH